MNREAKGLRVQLFEMRRNMDLTNEQWEVLEPLIPEPVRRADGRGRPWRNSRDVFNGILWVLRTGAPWRRAAFRRPNMEGIQSTEKVREDFDRLADLSYETGWDHNTHYHAFLLKRLV